MPYDISWYDADHSIVLIHIHGEVTWDAWYKAVDQTIEKINEVPHRVDLIYVDDAGFPPGNALPHLKESIERLAEQPNLGLSITVSASRGLTMLVQVAVNVVLQAFVIDTSNNGGFARSVDHAVARIQASRKKNGAHT